MGMRGGWGGVAWEQDLQMPAGKMQARARVRAPALLSPCLLSRSVPPHLDLAIQNGVLPKPLLQRGQRARGDGHNPPSRVQEVVVRAGRRDGPLQD